MPRGLTWLRGPRDVPLPLEETLKRLPGDESLLAAVEGTAFVAVG